MISMTAYWQQFKEGVDNLSISTQDIEYSRQIATAHSLTETGLTIEKLGLLEIQQISEQLYEKAKLFQNAVSYTTDNHEHTFYLPKIVNAESFIFAIIYYQHLVNYQNVSYQGSINWFRQKVIDGINQKKITTEIQAQALLQEIRQYYQKHNLNVNEALFLKTEHESITEYTSRIVKAFSSPVEHSKEEKKSPIEPPDELSALEKTLELSNHKWKQLKSKVDSIDEKFSVFKQAKRDYFVLFNEWKNKWFLTKAVYWFISLFIEVPEIKNLRTTREHLIQTKHELNQELMGNTPKSYCAKLQKQLRKLELEQVEIKKELVLKKEKQQKDPMLLTLEHSALKSRGVEADLIALKKNDSSYLQTSSNNDYYAFFKRNLPSRYTLQAVAVAAAAVAIQNLL